MRIVVPCLNERCACAIRWIPEHFDLIYYYMADNSQLEQDIRSYVVSTFLFGTDDGFPPDASLLERGILDSTGALELVNHLENAYAIKVETDEMIPENLDSVVALTAFVTRKRAALQPA